MWHTSNIPFCKLDHVDSVIFTEFSSAAYRAKWLLFSKLVTYHSLFLMFFHYHPDYGRALPLEPPLQFGNLFVYHKRTKNCFAGVVCHLQSFFCHRAAQYWNSLPTNIKDHVQFGDFKSSVKTYPLNLCFVYVVICVSV